MSDVFGDAKRKARYGHRYWIAWKDRDGTPHAEIETAASLKRAMLATGTSGRLVRYWASSGISELMGWSVATLAFKNARAGYGANSRF